MVRRRRWRPFSAAIDRGVKHVHLPAMKTMTVRDIRQRWPEAEQALAREKEIIITRDGQPVAKLTRIVPEKTKRKRFDPAEQKRRREEVFGKDGFVNWVQEFCEVDRAERF